MQARGSLAETSVRALLQAAVSEGATGKLSLHQPGREDTEISIFFGRIVHAAGASSVGDDAVRSVLDWTAGSFEFDPRSRMPDHETVTSGMREEIGGVERPDPSGSPLRAEEVTAEIDETELLTTDEVRQRLGLGSAKRLEVRWTARALRDLTAAAAAAAAVPAPSGSEAIAGPFVSEKGVDVSSRIVIKRVEGLGPDLDDEAISELLRELGQEAVAGVSFGAIDPVASLIDVVEFSRALSPAGPGQTTSISCPPLVAHCRIDGDRLTVLTVARSEAVPQIDSEAVSMSEAASLLNTPMRSQAAADRRGWLSRLFVRPPRA